MVFGVWGLLSVWVLGGDDGLGIVCLVGSRVGNGVEVYMFVGWVVKCC